MSEQKALQFLDKNDLECAICLERLTEPKTLECLHSYCLHCLQSLIKTSGKIKCPKCCKMYDDLNQFDLKDLTTNEMLSYQVKFVGNIESEKPPKCSSCDNQPEYYCSECQMYLCGQCIKHHKIIPVLKNHPLYTLDKIQGEGKDLPHKCIYHRDCMLEFYCRICLKSGCKKCEHVLRCYQNEHNVIPFETAVDEFNQNATEVKKSAEEIKEKLKRTRESFMKERSDFELKLKLCRTAIELQEENIIKKAQEKTRAMLMDLDKIDKENKELIDNRVKNIDSKLLKVNEMLPLINTMMNKPEERETLRSHEENIDAVKEETQESKYDESIKIKAPTFIPSKNLDKLIDLEGIGKMSNVECAYQVAEDKVPIIVTKGQPFEVKVVSSLVESEESILAATLINKSGEESATEVKYQGSGEYRITGRCHKKGDWKMKITARREEIKGSPVNIKVEALGLVHTTDNIEKLKVHNKNENVYDVILDKEGNLIVTSFSKDLLKFNQECSFIGRIEIPDNVKVVCIHQMSNGQMVYSDYLNKTVVKCDDKFQQICTFGKGTLKQPGGLTVNKETRTMYVADGECHCVFKFNVDSGELIGRFGSKGSKEGEMYCPDGLALTKEGNLIVVDSLNHRIQMFDANDKFMKILVGKGDQDGHFQYPHYVAIDSEENLLVSSNNKLQLLDQNGVFLKRIYIDYGGLDDPCGVAIISKKPRRVAVAIYRSNKVNVYNY
ncbi:uncharacterized protein [Antedon mediterranea]|uniref:uncharacterized protein n=1 Tax=Antedon mediterranea TaxID=105859 RepID=UPI003AF7BD52